LVSRWCVGDASYHLSSIGSRRRRRVRLGAPECDWSVDAALDGTLTSLFQWLLVAQSTVPRTTLPRSMSDYRRYFVAGGTYFFTVVTYQRRRFLTTDLARECLRAAIETARGERPFEMPAVVLLPDHLHALWSLPRADVDYSTRWRRVKEQFTSAYMAQGGREGPLSASRRKRGERGVWQRRFWEHAINDENDFERHFDYIHYNPVKHRLVDCPRQWPYSTFSRWVAGGVYGAEWGCRFNGTLDFSDVDKTALE
jgi:putative transposase